MGFTFGIQKIESGDPGNGGTMAATLATHDETLKGTANLSTSDPSTEWIQTEEGGKRLNITTESGETTLEFEVADPSLDTMAHYLGGTVKTGPPESYAPPATQSPLYLSFKITTVEGYDIEIPYGKVTAKPLGGDITSDSVMTLSVSVAVQNPSDAATDPITFVEKQ